DNEKMSKSLGNFFTIREVLKQYDAEVIRYFILTSHYRSPLNYSDAHLDNAKGGLTSLYTALRGLDVASVTAGESEYSDRFYAAMDDDFNTPEALAVLFELAREVNRYRSEEPQRALQLAAQLKQLGALLGLLQRDPEAYLKGGTAAGGPDDAAIEALIAARLQARAEKNWAEADRLRDELKAQGILIEDGPQGTTWRRE
ncbi:MAG TPA: DALR domain-containing protein, partial [Gammaproteobacteria bacterium]